MLEAVQHHGPREGPPDAAVRSASEPVKAAPVRVVGAVFTPPFRPKLVRVFKNCWISVRSQKTIVHSRSSGYTIPAHRGITFSHPDASHKRRKHPDSLPH